MLKKRIPTIVGLILLIIGAFAGVLFIDKTTDFLPRASPEYAPQKVKITNLTENGFTVSWVTQEPTIGFVKYGDTASNLNTVATDERDQLSGNSNQYRTHYITIQNLKPSKEYYFKLGSQKNQLYDNNGQAFKIITPAIVGTPPPADTAYGTVMTAANTPAEGAIVYVSIEGATPVSALVKQNGNWAVNLSTARTPDLKNYATYDPVSTKLDILVQPSTGQLTTIVTTTSNDQPVPTITLGQNAEYLTTQAAQPVTPPETNAHNEEDVAQSAESKLSLQPVQPVEGENDPSITITTLPKDGTVITSTQPSIQGKAPPNTTLTISVHSSQAYTGQVATDQRGNWKWTPPGNLEPGNHTLTISYLDAEGLVRKVTRQFVVNAAGDVANLYDPVYESTPSAQPSPTPIPAATPLPTPQATPKARTVVASQSAEMQAGSAAQTITMLLLGISIVTAGAWVIKKDF